MRDTSLCMGGSRAPVKRDSGTLAAGRGCDNAGPPQGYSAGAPKAGESAARRRSAGSPIIVTTAASSANPASAKRPPPKLPVVSLIVPTTQGVIVPARLPSALIQAIPAAAAVPVRNRDGIGQKDGFMP